MPENLPSAFIDRMRALLGAEADAFFAAYDREERAGLRVNLLKLRPEHFQHIARLDLEPVPWCPSGFFVDPAARPGKHPYHAAGLYYLQEPSAMAVVEALQVRAGQRVIDLAAAPGGKATQIAAALEGSGLLIANEIDGGRIKALGENLERWGAANAIITSETPERLADHFGATFDRVLIDAPCSGEGMFRKRAIARQEWSREHVAGCAIRQARILEQAIRLVAPGGLLVYSTCTFAPEENEQRIADLLRAHPSWSLVDLPKRHGFESGRPEWAEPRLPNLGRAVRLWPHRVPGEGHFVALLRQDGRPDTPPPDRWPERGWRSWLHRGAARPSPDAPSAEMLAAWHTFARATLTIDLPDDRLLRRGEQLYLVPDGTPDLDGLRVIRSGLWLGTVRPGRFEPAHALALSLLEDDAQMTLRLDQQQALRYLHGETIAHPGPDGWLLILVDGWPLGWGRRVGDTVKNFYPKGLRWM